ncbi:unnamed protein product [Ectocarpus sp. 4 AP-2014]
MEVRWRLFARDVLSLLPDDSGEFRFGRPLRPVRGLRLLGIVVHRARAESSRLRAAGSGSSGGKKRARGGSGYGGGGERASDDSAMDGEFGLLGIDDGTGVVEVRLPLRLWDTVALWEQLDVVGTPERLHGSLALALASKTSKTLDVTGIRADGCHVEADPNVACLRALECIDRYKCCYFSRSWSPSGAPLPPLLPDPHAGDQPTGNASRQADGTGVGKEDAGDWGSGHGQSEEGGGVEGGSSLEARLSGLIGSMGGATGAQLVAELGLPQGHGGVESALAQASRMQLEGAIYLAGDCYMPL